MMLHVSGDSVMPHRAVEDLRLLERKRCGDGSIFDIQVTQVTQITQLIAR